MKENSEVQSKTILQQKAELSKLSAQLHNFESPSSDSSQEQLKRKLEITEEDLESYKKLLIKYQEDLKSLKTRLLETEQDHSKCLNLRAESDQLRQKLEKYEDCSKTLTKQNHLNKKLEIMAKDKKLLEEKVTDLENDKRKLLDKWQK